MTIIQRILDLENKHTRNILRLALLLAVMTPAIIGCGKTEHSEPPTPSATPSLHAQEATDPAADFVRNFRLGSNLESMAVSTAAMTQTYATLPRMSVISEIRRLTPKYQDQWDANLAKAHSNHLSEKELRSLALEGQRSPHYSSLEKHKSAISADMKEMSSPILQQLVVEALSNASKNQ